MLPSGRSSNASVIASRLGLLVLAVAFGTTASAQRGAPAASSLRAEASADTLRYSVRAGETLIVGLPAGAGVEYRVERAPALSWLVDRSFMWRTLPQERGALPVVFRRLREGRGDDRLVLLVEIVP